MQFLFVLTLYPIIESTPPLSLLVLDVFFSPLLAPWKRIATREVLLVLSRATGFQKCAPFLEFIIFIHYIIIEIIHFCLLILLLNFYINNAIFLIPTSRMSILLLVYLFVLEQLVHEMSESFYEIHLSISMKYIQFVYENGQIPEISCCLV